MPLRTKRTGEKLYRVLIWGTGSEYKKYVERIKLQELSEYIFVVGITSNETSKKEIDGYTFYEKEDIRNINFDYIFLAIGDMLASEVILEANRMGVDTEQILPVQLLAIPEFNLEKYVKIKQSNLSIVASCCWGGLSSHSLFLPFNSPFVNMRIPESDFLRLLNEFDDYMKFEPVFERWMEAAGNVFPVMKLRDVELHCVHYENAQQVLDSWRRRVQRINYKNIFVMMETTSHSTLECFSKLPFENKICFIPFKSDLDCAFFLDKKSGQENKNFNRIVNETAMGKYKYYDLLDLLCPM